MPLQPYTGREKPALSSDASLWLYGLLYFGQKYGSLVSCDTGSFQGQSIGCLFNRLPSQSLMKKENLTFQSWCLEEMLKDQISGMWQNLHVCGLPASPVGRPAVSKTRAQKHGIQGLLRKSVSFMSLSAVNLRSFWP